MQFLYMCSLFMIFSSVITVGFINNTFAQHALVPDIVDNIQRLSVVGTRHTNHWPGPDLAKFIEASVSQWPRALTQTSLEGLRLSSNITACVGDIQSWVEELSRKSMWALDMLDATGKPSSGLLRGETRWMGEYNECLNVQIQTEVNGSMVPSTFSTAYCSLTVGNPTAPVTLVWDVCVPSSCENGVLQLLINKVILNGEYNVSKSACSDGERLPMTGGAIAVICLLSALAALVISSTMLDIVRQFKAQSITSGIVMYSDQHLNDEVANSVTERVTVSEHTPLLTSRHTEIIEPNDVYFVKFLLSFSLCKNARKILTVNASPTDGSTLHAIHGIRFLSMSWVILGHTWAFSLGYARNLLDMVDIATSFSFQAIMNATVSVDTFFLLSGTLLSYQLLRELRRRDESVSTETRTQSCTRWMKIVVHRYLRLTPVYMLMLAIFTTLYMFWFSGPFVLETGDNACYSNWWTNLLYINNLAFSEKQCFPWAWYLANDMQLFVVSLGLVVIIYKHFTTGVVIVSVMTSLSCVITGVITFVNDYPASPSSFIHYPNLNQANWYRDIYNPPWCRAGPYLVGVLLGAILYRCNCKVYLHRVLVLIFWFVAAALNLTILYGLYNDLNGHYMNGAERAIYAGVHRTLWSIGVAWVIFACVTGYGGFVNTLLSWTGLIPLSRLTYAAYLIHPMVVFWCYGNLLTQLHVTYITMIYMFCGHLLLSYALAFIVSATCEASVINIIGLVIKK